jgi:bifunctional non-homologous end joining protein LigD
MPIAFPSAAIAARVPADIRLQIVSPSARPPDGNDWLHEIKHDGHRLIAIIPGRGS